MAEYYRYLDHANRKNNKVYINPNYNRTENATTSSSSMYFNPNFSHITPMHHNNKIDQKHEVSKAKIYVNPNFIRKTNNCNPIVNRQTIVANQLTHVDVPSHSASGEQQLVLNNQSQAPSSLYITKSRHSFVRQKENIVTNPSITRSVNTTVKINKYKSVSMSVVKSNLAVIKHPKSTTQSTFAHNIKPKSMTRCHLQNTSFKYFKSNNATPLIQPLQKYPARRPSLINKSLAKSVSQKKKNNIPCPLFKKYGLCLRKMRGNCEFSHDKKHISICRKFLKGICHDNNCLLSHDLTDKKMPTCYFYLQGACNKESCPYLHVKLNEKTKICQEFLRGYCEKGEKCLFRHVNASYTATKRIGLVELETRKSNLVAKSKSRKKYLVTCNQKEKNASIAQAEGGPAIEHRYFKESVQENISGETYDIIKPSRIKLGTLPSFIQL